MTSDRSRKTWALIALLAAFACRADPVEVSLHLPSGAEIVSQRYPARGESGRLLALWLTDGRSEDEQKAAADMATRGVETWVTDFLAPYFLPVLSSSWSQIPEQDLREWLETLHTRNPGQRIVLIASGRAATLALRAANDWQARHGEGAANRLAGALLMWPLLYQELAPGQEPDYDPIVRQTHLNLVILQPKSSAGFWWRERLKNFLEGAGSRVWLNVLPGLRDGFYGRGDITPREISASARLGEMLLDGLKPLLDKDKP
ncbi:MAG: hypothetical protein CO126_08965 [Hydrogenophilales bacterium CG_4_9_14_3_um_filter_63_34]|nr:MAG: hypothetical protein COZ24_08555 [Hydrogenophilales bacterium CG_4_10_14_3_um_filter_63_21]PJB03009.1 MAG: hypothetical protein CO126_08965 [Hydrogenophilales bacterium CG_4_9_14_3_um_filter_63_34]